MGGSITLLPQADSFSWPSPAALAPDAPASGLQIAAAPRAIENIILPNESIEDFQALEAAWNKTFDPKDETVAPLVSQLIAADWLYQRSVRTLINIESQIFTAEPNPLKWDHTHHKALSRFQRNRTANQNAFNKARKAVEDHLKYHANESRQTDKRSVVRKSTKSTTSTATEGRKRLP